MTVKQVNVRMSKELAEAATKHAKMAERPLNQIIRDLVRNWVKRQEAKANKPPPN